MPVRFNRSRKPQRRYGVVARLACLGVVLALVVAAPPSPHAIASPAVRISSQSEQILQTLLTARNSASSAGLSERSEIVSRQFREYHMAQILLLVPRVSLSSLLLSCRRWTVLPMPTTSKR